MFWKNVKWKSMKSWPLAWKLMLLYALSTIGIFAAVCIFLYPSFMKATHSQYHAITTYEIALDKKNALPTKKVMIIKCYKEAITALLGVSIAAIVMGYIVAANALKTLREFTQKIENISANSLNEPINPGDWPKELTVLASRFNLMLDRVHKSFLQLSQFSSDIAHELRSPINNLRISTELALREESTVEQYQKLLESHLEEYQLLSQLIENLLFIARTENGQMTVKKNIYNAGEEISKIIEYFHSFSHEKNIQIICEGEAVVYAEKTLFGRAMSNLLSNAIRYSPENARIIIHIKCEEEYGTVISISDTGIGIPKDKLSKVFDRFYRADPSRSEMSGGVGLGLAIVKSIVDLHQGSITIESELNVGTTIHLRFPIAPHDRLSEK